MLLLLKLFWQHADASLAVVIIIMMLFKAQQQTLYLGLA